MIDHTREALVETIRILSDLADVSKAIEIASRMTGEKLEETAAGLQNALDHLEHRGGGE
jgi:hypothetical protein